MLQQSCYSTSSSVFEPTSLPLPIIRDDLDTFSIKNVEMGHTRRTLAKVIEIQEHFPLGAVPRIVFFIFVGIVITYLGLIFIVLSLFNLVVFVILVVLILRYGMWTIESVRKHRRENERKLIKAWLDKQNKQVYATKLIRWQLDESQILVHNLRLCT